MLAQVDALPCPQQQPAAAHGNGHRRAQQRGFDVGRHVVGSFDRVAVIKILRRDGVERRLHVGRHVGIGIFVDRQRGTRVLNEHVQHAHFNPRQLGHGFDHVEVIK